MADVDVLVIGGGPGGSTVGALLAAAGHRVLLVERERFPRFHVGESLLPQSAPILRRLGVWDRVDAAGFQRKWGAHFLFEPERGGSRFQFSNGLDPDNVMSFQVRRAEFDHLLLANAVEKGVALREAEVTAVTFDGDRATGVRLRGPGGGEEHVAAKVVVDATGRDTLLGKQLGLRERDPALRQVALFSHFRGGRMGLGRDGGDILVVGSPVGWFWLIPLDADTVSVGIVAPGSVMQERRGRSLDEFYGELVARSPEVSGRLAGAERVEDVHPIADFSYRLGRFGGDGWAAVGDAAAFLDPVFSSGVHIALATGARAADAIAHALSRRGRLDAADLAGYERWARRGLDHFRRYIVGFYKPEFVAVFSGEPPLRVMKAGVATALAGSAFDRGLRQRALEAVFFLAVANERRRIRTGRIPAPTAPPLDHA
jgi:flavin-dependent dehydrogenase